MNHKSISKLMSSIDWIDRSIHPIRFDSTRLDSIHASGTDPSHIDLPEYAW
eukprot:jgi/Psemu1/315538/fgenesh1_kg.2206_\